MPARPPHVMRCGDLETACTEVLLYLQLNASSPECEYVSDQAFYCRGDSDWLHDIVGTCLGT
jgi:hypothetical protein